MSQVNLKDLLANLRETNGEDIEKARTNKGNSGAWDMDLPVELEYRVEVGDAKYGPSNAGKPQITLTFEVQEPEEWVGAKLQGYTALPAKTEADVRTLSSFVGIFGENMADFGKDVEGFARSLIGETVVIAVNKWGEANDRTGVRYMNRDLGQNLSTSVKPPKARRGSADLRPDINIPKDDAPAETSVVAPPAEVTETVAPAPAQTAPLPGGVNLPPGLGGRG